MVDPLIEQWLLWQVAGGLSMTTVTERCRVIVQLRDESGKRPSEAEPMDIIHWLSRHTEWSHATRATYHAYLRAYFNWLCLMDHRSDNPMIKLPPPRYPERVPRPVADRDLVGLLATPMHHRTRIMILLAALEGLRVSEIARVRGEDIDICGPKIYVVGKRAKQDWLPLHPILVEASQTMPLRGWWFPANNRRPGDHIHSKSVSDIIGSAMRRAGARGTPHGLRHWTGSTLLDDGADLRTIQELLRHKQLTTTAIYTKVPDARRYAATNRLDPFRGVA